MSGLQLTALVATLAALAALVGVGALVLQVRRLRAEMSAARADPTQAGEPLLPSRATWPDQPSATVVELVPMARDPAPRDPVPPGEPRPHLPVDLHRSQQPRQMVAARLARPLVRVSAVSYGLRHALRPENRDRVVALVRRDLRRRHKLRRLAGRRAFRVVHLRPDDSTGRRADRQESAS